MSRTEPLAFSPLPQPLPSLEEVLEDAAVVDLPMTSRFRGLQRRESMLVRGPQGWAEFAAFPEYDDAEALAWWRCALEVGWLGLPRGHRR